jgi:signal transduction histidine kinase
VFAAVTAEAGRVFAADFATMSHYNATGTITAVGLWTSTGIPAPVEVGKQLALGGRNVSTIAFETGRPARIEYSDDASGAIGQAARDWGMHTAVGVPIDVEGRVWGVVTVASTRDRSLPADTEARLVAFTELVGTAIANAEAQAALTASRARIVAAADTTRRRIERDLHDGAQQRLVSIALRLRTTMKDTLPSEADSLKLQLDDVAAELGGVLDELRELARGLHPAALVEGGLRPALRTLARRSAVPVRLDLRTDARFSEPVELAAYYVVAEALTNAAKHATASVMDVRLETVDGMLHVCVRDDGCGGADVTRGTGLLGLTDRVEALGGTLALSSARDQGTTVDIRVPVHASV